MSRPFLSSFQSLNFTEKKRTENNFHYISPQADVHNSKQLVKVYYSLAMK